MDDSNKQIEMLHEFYHELRNYRNKEFQTFIFTFPILGIGFLPSKNGVELLPILILITIFGIVMIRYLYMNHNRMLILKKEIVNFQGLLGVNDMFKFLDPIGWVNKRTENHLGTWTYIILLGLEVISVWFVYILIYN